MAGLLTVSGVVGVGPTYDLEVNTTVGILVNDHFTDNNGDIYRVSEVTDSTHIEVTDDVAPDSPEGTPVTGEGSYYTPTSVLKLSQAPRSTPSWDEILRRDARRLDAVIPADIGAIPSTEKAAANGVATLGADSKIPSSQIPAVGLPEVHVVADEAARLALTVQEGDEAVQLDTGSHWIWNGSAWYERPRNIPHASSHLPSGGDPLATATPGSVQIADAAAEGTAESFARSDHTHSVGTPAAPANVTKAAAATGTSTTPARADHKHDVTTAAPPTGIGAGNNEGSATSLARSDHNHTIRESGGQNLTLGAITDGQYVRRSGTTLAGDPGPGFFGQNYGSSRTDAEATTTSATYVQRHRHTTPSLPAGDYYIGYQAEFSLEDENSFVGVRAQLDDTTDLGEVYQAIKKKWTIAIPTWHPFAGHQVVTLGAGVHTIDIDYLDEAAGNIAHIRRARVVIWRVS